MTQTSQNSSSKDTSSNDNGAVKGDGSVKAAKAKARKAAETVNKAAREAQDSAKAQAQELYEQGSDVLEAGRDEIGYTQIRITDAVRKNPGAALAGAVGIGVLLGVALTRRS